MGKRVDLPFLLVFPQCYFLSDPLRGGEPILCYLSQCIMGWGRPVDRLAYMTENITSSYERATTTVLTDNH